MQKDWRTSAGEMSDELRSVLGQAEEVVLYQRSIQGNLMIVRWVGWAIAALLACSAISAMGNSDGAGALLCYGPGILVFLALPFLIPIHEYVVTKTRLIIGKTQWGSFSYDVVPMDMISGVKVRSAFGSGSGVEIQRAGGNLQLPVLGGKGGQNLALTLTRLMEERRTFSAASQSGAYHTPPPVSHATPPPSSPPMTKQERLSALRDRLLQGQISEATYNMLRQEIENE